MNARRRGHSRQGDQDRQGQKNGPRRARWSVAAWIPPSRFSASCGAGASLVAAGGVRRGARRFPAPTTSAAAEPRQYTVGVATARVLVDTPQSQVIKVDPKGSDTLGLRASVLANLMVEGEARAAIARRAGLKPRQLRPFRWPRGERVRQPSRNRCPPRSLDKPDIHMIRTRVIATPTASSCQSSRPMCRPPTPRAQRGWPTRRSNGLTTTWTRGRPPTKRWRTASACV